MGGLKGILQTGCLWASHIKYLNDSLEYEFIWQIIRSRIDKKLDCSVTVSQDQRERLQAILDHKHEAEIYVASFSDDNGDQLNQWRGYCPTGIGFSVGFSVDVARIRRSE